jgi:hypothetical protein
MEGTATFGQLNFEGAELGDLRRTKRLVDLADQFVARPGESLPDKAGTNARYQAACRLMNCPDVTHEAVLQPHLQLTWKRACDCPGVVLFLHDTTEVDYSKQLCAQTMGQIGNGGGRGYECHNSLAVDARTREVLGLANQILHTRRDVPEKEGVAAKRDDPQRESRLWTDAVRAIGAAPPGCFWIDVCDRGADIYEFLEYEVANGRPFLVRSKCNRRLDDAEDKDPLRLLHNRLRSRPSQGTRKITIGGRSGKPTREATMQICWEKVSLRSPHVRRGEHSREPIELWAIRVWEVNPPEGCEPTEWLLLTNVPIHNVEDAWQCVEWYAMRWIVEEYHKCQKSGVKIEELQFTTAQAIEPMFALLSVVAVGLLNTREAARDPNRRDQPAAIYVGTLSVRVLSIWRYKEARPLTVLEYTMALAKLGGHLNRKCDGLPGWQTLWRGQRRLNAMIEYELSRATCDKD